MRHIVLNTGSDQLNSLNVAASPVGSPQKPVKPVQRYSLIKGILSTTSHSVIYPLVCQALFIDWLFFDKKYVHLYEPGIHLIFNTVDQQPQITAKLIEFLYQTCKTYDQTRSLKFFLSVQNVLLLCE